MQDNTEHIQSENNPVSAEYSISILDIARNVHVLDAHNRISHMNNYGVFATSESNFESISPLPSFTLTRNSDYYDSVGNYVANELRNLSDDQTEIAQKLITYILYQARMGKLTANSEISTISSSDVPFKN